MARGQAKNPNTWQGHMMPAGQDEVKQVLTWCVERARVCLGFDIDILACVLALARQTARCNLQDTRYMKAPHHVA